VTEPTWRRLRLATSVRLLVLFLLTAGLFVAQEPKVNKDECGFSIRAKPGEVAVTGPDDIVPLVHVVNQPDSPIDILAVDLEGTWLSVSNNEYTDKTCAKYRIRNRSDQPIASFVIELDVRDRSGGTGSGARSSSVVAPGQTADVTSCGGNGHGGALGNRVRILIYVHSIDFGDCLYRPSLRIPASLGVGPP
jgi:hypothetical protein